MRNLRDRLRVISPALRDRLGLLCAVGAVACLSSIIAHWSREYPVQRSAWEQNLFDDLTDFENASPAHSTSMPHANLTPPSTQIAAVAPVAPLNPAEKPPAVHAMPNPADSLFPTPIAERPPEEQPRFIQPVVHEEPVPTQSAWLCGSIELENETAHTSTPADEPVNLHFP